MVQLESKPKAIDGHLEKYVSGYARKQIATIFGFFTISISDRKTDRRSARQKNCGK